VPGFILTKTGSRRRPGTIGAKRLIKVVKIPKAMLVIIPISFVSLLKAFFRKLRKGLEENLRKGQVNGQVKGTDFGTAVESVLTQPAFGQIRSPSNGYHSSRQINEEIDAV
jgi:hypothetical protein